VHSFALITSKKLGLNLGAPHLEPRFPVTYPRLWNSGFHSDPFFMSLHRFWPEPSTRMVWKKSTTPGFRD